MLVETLKKEADWKTGGIKEAIVIRGSKGDCMARNIQQFVRSLSLYSKINIVVN